MDVTYEANMTHMISLLDALLSNQNLSFQYSHLSPFDKIKLWEQLNGISIDENIAILDESDLQKYTEFRVHKALQIYVPPLLLFLGTIGNVLSFFILRHKTMTRLSTNLFLAALSVADSSVLFIGLFRKWLGELIGSDVQDKADWLCKCVSVLGYSTSQYSVWLIVAVTVERYVVVCHPLQASRYCNTQRARKIVIILACVFFVINCHLFWTSEVREDYFNGKLIRKCEGAKAHEYLVAVIWPWIDAVLYSMSPTVIITLFNILIIRQVVRATSGRDILQNGPLIKVETRRCAKDTNAKLTVMLLTVSFTFLATTLPMNVVMIATVIWKDQTNDASSLARFWLIRTISELLMYLNHSINFFLYCATGQKFRNIVVRLICGRSVSNVSNLSDHSQHLYCSRAYGVNGCTAYKHFDETAI